MEPLRFRVLADYEVNDPHPLQVEADLRVDIVRTDTSWPGWIWVRCGEQTGWIPARCLSHDQPEKPARTTTRFDGTELSARRGEFLEALETAPGWIFARNAAGERGWFPLFNLKPAPNT